MKSIILIFIFLSFFISSEAKFFYSIKRDSTIKDTIIIVFRGDDNIYDVFLLSYNRNIKLEQHIFLKNFYTFKTVSHFSNFIDRNKFSLIESVTFDFNNLIFKVFKFERTIPVFQRFQLLITSDYFHD